MNMYIWYHGLNVRVSPKFTFWNLMYKVMVRGKRGDIGRWSGHEDRTLMNGASGSSFSSSTACNEKSATRTRVLG